MNIYMVYLFDGISTFVGYLTPKISLLNSSDTIQSIADIYESKFLTFGTIDTYITQI